jgi:hypothetical protein
MPIFFVQASHPEHSPIQHGCMFVLKSEQTIDVILECSFFELNFVIGSAQILGI